MAKRTNKVASLLKVSAPDYPMPPSSLTAEAKARERRYQAEDALRTLTRAAEIQRDKNLMRDVRSVAHQKMKELSTVAKRK